MEFSKECFVTYEKRKAVSDSIDVAFDKNLIRARYIVACYIFNQRVMELALREEGDKDK